MGEFTSSPRDLYRIRMHLRQSRITGPMTYFLICARGAVIFLFTNKVEHLTNPNPFGVNLMPLFIFPV